jgi:GTPase SAR1 family protein
LPPTIHEEEQSDNFPSKQIQPILEESVSPLGDAHVHSFDPTSVIQGSTSPAKIQDPPSMPNSPPIIDIPSPSPPPRQVEISTFSVSDDDDEISVTPSPTNKGREFTPVSHVLKVIVLGDASVGKTAMIQRFVHGTYQVLPYKPTVWDTAGQERYRSLASSFYRGADVCILAYDGSRLSSLTSLDMWKSDFLKHAQPNNPDTFPFIVLRNKADLIPGDESFESISGKFHIPKSRVISVSAKSGLNVEKAFHLTAKIGVKKALKSSLSIRAQANARLVNLASQPGIRLGNNSNTENEGSCSC